MKERSPVVAVVGHVDHGKTTLLDTIRKTNVTAREEGGITQKIGAYEVCTEEGKYITFIDTPGHEVFINLRQRGVQTADIVLLVVAADSSVQPQTLESIRAIHEAKVPCIVVITKTDVPNALPEKVIKDLAKANILLEGRGGETPYVLLNAKEKKDMPQLLELITLVSELQSYTYDPKQPVEGSVIEVRKDRRGIIPTIILKNGSIDVGTTVYIGGTAVRVRALVDQTGKNRTHIEPATPFELLGMKDITDSGALVLQNKTEITQKKEQNNGPSWEDTKKKFNFLVRADSFGSLEVIREKLKAFEEIDIISSDIGEPTERDIETASSTSANMLVFQVPVRSTIQAKADAAGVGVFHYMLIYELLEEIEDLIVSLRERRLKESRKVGEARIMAIFVKENKKIAGLKVISGQMEEGSSAEITRGRKILGETTISSIFKKTNPVPLVRKGDECGAIFTDAVDFKQGDIVKLYVQ